jgi:hypothetical protein
MRAILLPVLSLLVGTLVAVYGGLLAWNPDAFLRFHDTFIDRSRSSRSATWRKQVYSLEYTIVGWCLLAVGIFFVIMMLRDIVRIVLN